MSTHSAVVVERIDDFGEGNPNSGLRRRCYARSHDGYLTGVGLELVQIAMTITRRYNDGFKTFSEADAAMQGQLNQSYRDRGDVIWSDIEFLYVVNFNDGITITAYCRPRSRDREYASPFEWPHVEIFKQRLTTHCGEECFVIDHVTISRATEVALRTSTMADLAASL